MGIVRTESLRVRLLTTVVAMILIPSLHGARVEIVEGNPASAVKVFLYEDLQCSDCQTLREILDQKLLPKYGRRVAFIHRDFPLPKHEWARDAAIAGRWIYERNTKAGIEFRREVLSEQNHLTVQGLPSWLRQFALRNHLDPDGITNCLSDGRLIAALEQDIQAGSGRGVKKTPTVYIGNQSFVETIIYEDIAHALDVELGH